MRIRRYSDDVGMRSTFSQRSNQGMNSFTDEFMRQIQKYNSSDKRVSLPLLRLQGTGRRPSAVAGTADKRPLTWRGAMKAILAALALVTLIATPTFAQSAPSAHWEQTNVSPSSSNFGDNGY